METNVVYDSSSKRPGGFGFVTFTSVPEEKDKILEIDHFINGTKVSNFFFKFFRLIVNWL